MNRKAKRVSKFFVVMFVFLLALALVLGSTGAYYRAMRRATGTIHLQKGIVVDYTGFSGDDVEWTGANATSFELFDERSAIPGEDINLVQTSIKADETSVNFYARAKIEYAFDGTNNGSPVSNIQNISNIPFSASDLITADVFASNWKQSANDEWNYFVSGNTYGTFVAGGAYINIFKQGAKLSIEGTNFHGADDEGSGGGFVIAGTDYVITTIRASLVLEFIQANAGAVSDMNWNYVEQSEDPAPATYTDASGVTYTLNNEGTGYIVTGGIISQDGNGGSVSGYSAKVGNSSASAYESSYSYTILSYIHGLPVIEVAANAFAGNDAYISIVIPTTIVLIGEGAINIYGSVTFQTGRLNSITIRVNGIPTGTTLPNGSTFDGSEAVDVPELYTLTLIDEKDNYYSFWEDFINENGYTYEGNGRYTIRLPYGTVGQLPAPTFDGYTFQYWNDEADGVQLPANEDLTIEGDVTAVAVYTENGQEPETYTLTLEDTTGAFGYDDDVWTILGFTTYHHHDEPGDMIQNLYYTAPYGTQITLPTLTRDGYTFMSWSGYTDSYTITETTTLYSQWEENQQGETYTLTIYVNSEYENYFNKISGWNYDGKEGYITKTFSEGSDVTFPTPNEYNLQTLLGYYDTNPDKTSNPQAFGSTRNKINDNWTYYFIYEGISGGSTEYTITLYDNKEMEDGYSITGAENYVSYNTFYIEQTVTSGTSVTLPTPSCNNYTFLYWDDNGSHYSGGESYTVTDDVTLTAVWESAPSTTYVYSESELRSALNDSSVYLIALGEDIYISDVIRATISDRNVTLDGNGYTVYASQGGTLKDYAFVFTAGDSNGSIVIDELNLVINDGFRSGMMLKKENSGNITATLQDSDITINHSSQPYKSGNPKNCVAIENNDSALIIKGSTTLTIDEYCWAAIDLDNSNNHVYLTFYDEANVTFVANNKGSMFEALVKVNEESGYNLVVSGYAAQGLVATLYGYDNDTTTYVYSESELRSALNDSSVSSITLGSDITISSDIRAAISDRDVVLNGAGYTITASQGGTLKDYAFIFESGSYNGSILIKDLTIVVNDGFRSAIKAEMKNYDGRVSVVLRNTDITIAHSYHPTKDKVTKNCVAIQNNYSSIYLKGTSTITIDEYCWAAIDLDSSNADAYLYFSEGANITFVAENKGSMYEALVKVNGKNSYVEGASAQGLVSTSYGYDYEQQGGNYTVTLAFADSKYMDNFDSSEFNDWTPIYDKSNITGYYKDGLSDGDKIYLPDDGKNTGYVWAYTDNDKDYSLEPGSTYKVYGDIKFTYQGESSSSTYYTISLRFNDTSLIDNNFKSSAFDGWTPIDGKYGVEGYSMSVKSGSKITLPNDNVDGYIWYYGGGMVSVNPGDSYTVNYDGVQFIYQEGTASTDYQDVIIDLNGYYGYSTGNSWYMTLMMQGFQAYGMNQFKKTFTSTGSFTLPSITRDGYTLLGYTQGSSMYYPGMNMLYSAGSTQMVMMLSGGTTYYYAQWQQGAGGTLTLNSSMMSYIDSSVWVPEFEALGWTNNGSNVYMTSEDPILLPKVSVNYNGQTKIVSYYNTSPMGGGMGTTYYPGQTYTPAGNSTLYIYWTDGATLTLYNEFDQELGHEWNYGSTSFTEGDPNYVSYVGGGSVELPSPTLDGYTFAYWQGSNGDLYAPGATYSLNGNNTLTAVWFSGTTYTVTLDVTNSGVDDESRFNWTGYYSNITKNSYQYQIVVEENDTITLPTSAYYLGSWVDSNDGSHSESMGATYQVTSDITFNFNYTGDVTRYTLTLNFQTDYDNNGDRYAWNSPYNYFNPGSLSFDGNYIYHEDEENAVITLPTAKVYSNRLIQGYFNTDEYGKGDSYQLGDIITLTDNITLYFISTGYEEYCTITLYTNDHLDLISNYDGWELDGKNDLVKSVTSGTTITLPTSNDPRVCWGDYDAGAKYYVDYSTSFSLQLREFYTATLNLNGNGAQITDGLSAWEDQGEGIYTKQVKEDVEFNLPTLESSYYWHYEYDGEEYYRTGEVNIREDTTFTLVYVQSYTATLHLNGLTPNVDGYSDFWNNFTNNGDGTYSRSFNIVDDWDLPGDWYFNSDSSNRLYWWFTDSECTNPVYDREDWAEGFTSDVDFYATSGPEQITVYFNANGGTIDNNNFTYSGGVYGYNTYYNSDIYTDNLVAPTKEGYTFLGWYTNASFTGINYSELVQYLDYEDDRLYWSVFGNGTTLYAKYSENYVYSNVIYSWNEDDNNWSVVGVTDEFNAETLTIESSIDDGAGHSGNVVKIANSAFAGRKIAQSGKKGGPEYENVYYSFTQVVIPATIVEIGDRAFYYNSDLTTVTFAQNLALTTIGSEAFAECLIPSFNIPASVTSIGEAAFDDCPLLTGITVDENNQVYSSYYGVVYNKDQTEIKIMTEGLTGIDGTVKIPATVTTINKVMYGSFVNLVFEGDITFGSVNSGYRGEDHWNDYLDSLATITFTNTDPITLGKIYNCEEDKGYIAFVPEDSVDAYNSFFSDHDNMRNWTAVSVSEKDSINPTNTLLDGVDYDDGSECYTYVDSIGIVYHLNQDGKTYTLYDATNADFSSYGEWDHLEINKTGPYNMFDITAIAENAFKNVSAAFCIEFADSVKTIGAYAFYNCAMINLASNICSDVIGEHAFYNFGSQRDSSPEFYLNAMGNQTIGAHAFDGAKANRIEFTGKFNNITVSIGEYAFANNPSSIYINFGDYNNIITYNIAANAFNGTEISNFQLGNNDYEDGSRGLTFNFATDSLNGADINEIYSYFPNTIISGLENSGISSSTVIKMPTDELVDTMAALLPSNTVKNYYRYDREDYTDSSGVVYRCMPRPGGNFYNYEYMLYSVPSSLEGTYTVPETINGSTIYGIWPGAFDDTQLTAVNFSVKANTDGGRAIVKTFANLPTTNANSQTITYGMFASLYEVISADSNFSSYTVEEIEEPHKLVIDSEENYYFGDMSDYSYGYINDLGNKYYKPFTSTTPSFTIPYHNGNYGENYELTFTVYVWIEDGSYWENTGNTLQGGATFNPADYSSDVRLNPNWNYVEQNYGNSYITVYVPNKFDLKGWTSEYDDVTSEYIMTYEYYYDGSSTTVYLPTEKNGMSKDGYSFEGWYSVDDWNSEYGRPNDGAKSVDSVMVDATDQYYEFYGYWVK